jgi:hypothetical protein
VTAGVAFQRAGILGRAPKQLISMFAAVVILVVVSLVLGVLIPDPPR